MKITFVIASLNSGGAERVLVNLANYFCQSGDKVNIILFSDEIFYKVHPDINISVIHCRKKGVGYIFEATHRLRERLSEAQPEVVISFLTEINVISILASIKLPWKLIISERNNPYIMPKKKAYRFLRKMLYTLADGYVFQTSQARAYFNTRIQAKSAVIHNPINVENLEINHDNDKDDFFSVVSVGRLEPQKNFKLLISAFAELYAIHKNCRLIIYGEGSLRGEITKFIEDNNLNSIVSLPGRQDDVVSKIVDASVFVISSDYEGMSNALMEAMSVGLPCISTDCPIGGSAELICNNVNGILVPVGNKDALFEALSNLYSNKDLRVKIGNKATEINSSHSIVAIVNQWNDYIKSIL